MEYKYTYQNAEVSIIKLEDNIYNIKPINNEIYMTILRSLDNYIDYINSDISLIKNISIKELNFFFNIKNNKNVNINITFS